MTLYRNMLRHQDHCRKITPLSTLDDPVLASPAETAAFYRALVGAPGDPAPVFIDVTGVSMEDEDMPKLCDMAALPPFDDAWIEWRDQGTRDEIQATCGVRIVKAPLPPGGRIRAVLSMSSVISIDTAFTGLGMTLFPVDERGAGIQAKTLDEETIAHWRALIKLAMPWVILPDTPLEELRAEGDNAYLQTVAVPDVVALQHSACVNVALSTYSLLNCRNIALAPTQAPPKTKKRKRWVPRGNVWHRLVVVKPGAKRQGARVEHGTGEWLTRAHMVRGHFKEFTAEHPLFGRYVGRWWWSPATRGDERLGTIEKEYVVQGGTE